MNRLLPLAALAAALMISCVDNSSPPGSGGGGEGGEGGTDTVDGGLSDFGGLGGEGGGGCMPTAEVCDGVDNDCDGDADEDFPVGDACEIEVGGCTSTGAWACDDAGGSICDAPPTEPTDEACDGVDNDCDGSTDEDFDLNTDTAHCGGCNQACDLANADAACNAAECSIAACQDGFGDPDGDPANGCECAISNGGDEACDGIDNDCDGTIDEGTGIGEACSVGRGACANDGVTVCGDDGAVVCGVEPLPPGEETCNGLDDDCDESIDEEFDADNDGYAACPDVDCDAPCPDGVNCEVVCARQDCRPNDPTSNPGAAEICEDEIDQNCDGRDISCEVPAGRMNNIQVAAPNGAGCRDLTGNGQPNNTFGNPALTAILNPELSSAVADGQINLIPITPGLQAPGNNGVFDLGVVFGRAEGDAYQLSPESIDGDGVPLMFFPGAEVDNGDLEAGPGNFLLNLPVNGVDVQLRVAETVVTGEIAVGEAGVTINNGWISGYVTEEDFQAALVIVPEDLRPLVPLLIQADIDTDDNGRPDAYSACVEFTAVPITLLGLAP